MRWLVCCLLIPLSANAASVLLVPQDEKARVLAEELNEPFSAQKFTVKMAGPTSPAAACLADKATRNACLFAIGERAKVVAVFVVGGALKGARGTVSLELLAGGAVVKKTTTTVTKAKVKQQMKAPIAALLKLLPKNEPAPVEPKPTVAVKDPDPEPVTPKATVTPKPVDAPTTTALTPRTTVEPVDLRQRAPVKTKPKVAAWVVTGLAVVAAGTAATFGGLGLAGKGRVEAAPNGVSELTYNDALALQESSNTQFTIALGAGIGAGVSGVVAGILWGIE